ncbi:Aste57867_21264 [Aphanomyces stellatus]|uniref:Aste57867_21264 protein n=1 Tax=Aphanomyces stellatus TaxID=120398 RepID=A0A485LLP3_9STRA|nr:hypothetical protein As57867_021195 [Aphanomyces stellatus]VFT97936.1 Aste57867_21264 [Aphanomyces stellatus]
MTAVAPHELKRSRPSRHRDGLVRIAGVTYVAVALLMAIKYMTILHAYVQNDYFWTDFNASGTQTFVADVFNRQLWNTTSGARDLKLFSIDVASEKDYSAPDTLITIQATDTRRIIMEQFNILSVAIAGIRVQPVSQLVYMYTCYCWLDFDHAWEVAHTAARQARCQAKYATNGAVYLEATLRNTDWTKFQIVRGSQFQVAYGSALQESPGGVAWLNQTTTALLKYTIDAEIQYWTQHAITQFTTPWQNNLVGRFDNSFLVRNAFQTFSVPLNRVLSQRTGAWTSHIASGGVWNDFGYASFVNASLVRNASNSFTKLKPPMDRETYTGGYPDTIWIVLFHDVLSPLSSLDLLFVVPPSSFVDVYHAAHTAFIRAIQLQSKLLELYQAFPSTTSFDMVPPTWQGDNVTYFGGNPFCYTGKGQTYPQQSFGFDDACSEPFPQLTLESQAIQIVLALWLQSNALAIEAQEATAVCAMTQHANQPCVNAYRRGQALLDSFLVAMDLSIIIASTIPLLATDLIALNISLMQYANEGGTPTLLLQPLLDKNDSHWSFYGWLHLLDWLQGTREVIAFEGDVDTLVLISKQYLAQSFVADPLQIPTRVSYILWLMIWYMCVVSAVVTTVAFACALFARSELSGLNLCLANPVVGVVWMGRPFMVVRGLTAMAVLSSATIQLERVHDLTFFSTPARPFLDVVVVTGETIWLTFALNDVVSVVANQYAFASSIMTCAFVWLTSLVMELSFPFEPTATCNRTCVSSDMAAQVNCVSGVVEIGSSTRFLQLCLVQCVCMGVSYCIARFLSPAKQGPANAPVIVPAIATHMFSTKSQADGLYYDAYSSVLCGLIPLRLVETPYLFNVVLWVLVEDARFRQPTLRVESNAATTSPTHSIVPSRTQVTQKLRASASVVFLIGSALSSALFFYAIQGQLSNDFMWTGFNTTAMQPFLIDWYNDKMSFAPQTATWSLDGLRNQAFYNESSAQVAVASFYASTLQFELVDLVGIIQGLQMSDACQLPWMATQYCWVDFDHEWEMANSWRRRERCQAMATNGAVYVEAIVRNVNLNRLHACWGDALDIGIYQELRRSTLGQQWMTRLGPSLPPAEERVYWMAKNITQFTVQWQNYMTLGVVETVSVENALGSTYPITLKSSLGAFQLPFQSSMKMYWGWASDLWAISQNNTCVSHRSLVRTSANFANCTPEITLMQNQTIHAPLDAGLTLLRDLVGPFGNIDLVHVPFPPSLLHLRNAFSAVYTTTMLSNISAQVPVAGVSQSLVPRRWLSEYAILRGGNILCPIISGKVSASYGLLGLYRTAAPCETTLSETLTLSLKWSSLALVACGGFQPCPLGSICGFISDFCQNSTRPSQCSKALLAVSMWTTTYIPPASLDSIFQLASQTKIDLTLLAIEVNQFAQKNASSPIELLRMALVASGDASFDLVGWHLFLEWVNGYREVMSLQGDKGTLTVISSMSNYVTSTPNPLEIPHNVSYYCQLCIQYTTTMVFLVTFFALVYAVGSQGYVEGLNMLEVSRVGGIVWVGRPFLFLRSLVAILILATSKVELQLSNSFTHTVTPSASGVQSLSILLAGSETCWLVIVLTDLFLAVTKDLTNKYSLKSSVVATILAIILSLVSPITPGFTVDRTCNIVQIDFQLTCHAGVIRIGSIERTLQLVVMTSAVVFLSFSWEYWRHPTFKLPSHRVSLLLPAGAHYLYNKEPWIFNDILYLDKASAFMGGLISCKFNQAVYVLDIKTWRAHTFDIDRDFDSRLLTANVYDQKRIDHALPMIE